jgi:hypothetical protein
MNAEQYTQIIILLKQIDKTQNTLYDKTLQLEKRVNSIETIIKDNNNYDKKIRRIVIKRSPTKRLASRKINIVDINDIHCCEPEIKHLDIVFFSSLKFAFFVALLETLCHMTHINGDCTKLVYEEISFCDNHYHIDIKSQLIRINKWFEDHEGDKLVLPFKKQTNIDADRKVHNRKNVSLVGYYKGQWCSSSYKNKLLSLYDSFCIKIIQRFGEWQDKYSDAIERNKLPKNLDYSECALKIMGSPENSNSLDEISSYLDNIL